MPKKRRKKKPKSTHRAYFIDECRGIGCGWRGITVRNIGTKWAHLTETSTKTNFRLRKSVWNSLRPLEV